MIIVILVVLGLCFGSFVNALVWRLHEQDKKTRKKKKGPNPKDLSIVKGRSMCPHCHHALANRDLIPVISWLWLKGKCRYCKKPIEDTPLVELGTALLFVASYIWWPVAFDTAGKVNFVVWLIVLIGFMALVVYDLRWLILPNKIIYPLIILATVLAVANALVFDGGTSYVRDTVIGLAIAGGLFYCLFEISKGKWIGGGDVKLGFLIGFLLASPELSFLALFFASLVGTVVILPGLITKKLNPKSHIPFGPFLIIATIIVKLFGAAIVAWYKRQFLTI